MSRTRSCELCAGAVLVLVLGHVISALEVPLDLLEGLPQPPTITYQSPKDYIIDPRENIVIHCEAKGKPHPSFSWTRNGTHFNIDKVPRVSMKADSGTLVIDISRERAEVFEGVYQCIARNEHGTAVSNGIVIRQSRSPLWSKERNDPIVVQEGVSLVLQCRPPAGLPPPIIFWMDNDFQRLPQSKRVSQALNGDLYFSNVLTEDTRNDYICYARFPHTQTIQQKQPITVKVLNNSPVEERQPSFLLPTGSRSAKMVLRGEDLDLECIAEGLPTPEISWSREGGALPSDRTSYHSFQKTLKIAEVTEADAGDYRCTASNHLDNVHHIISVTVKAAPYWRRAPKNLILSPRETGALTCEAGGTPKPTVTWSMNGVPIENAPKDPSRTIEDDTVTFSDVQTGSSAVYQCNASNVYGYLLANAFLNVLTEPPRVLTPPNQVYQVIRDTPALLDCASFGSPIPNVTWIRDDDHIFLSRDPYILHENGSLEIQEAHPPHSGRYTCLATNHLGQKTNHVYLEVKEPTRIVKQDRRKVVERNSDAVFECRVTHDPSLVPTVTWLKDNGELPDDERFVVDSDSLTITDVTEEDEGSYTCIMNTTLDQDSATAILTIVDAPPTPAIVYERPDPPADLELTDPQSRSVQLTWTPGDEHNSPIERFLIQYEDSLHEPDVWLNLTDVPGSKTTALLSLSPFAHYSFRVLALNHVGPSRPSEPSRQYRTEGAAPDENPSGVEGVGAVHNNMVISWKPLSGLQANGPDLQYKVIWRQKGVETDWSSVTVSNVSKFVVSGTPTFVPYDIKVQAVNKFGSGPEPEVFLGYSGEDFPTAAPGNIQVQILNSSLAEVQWDPVPPETLRGRLQGYKVTYWKERSLNKHHPHPEEQQVLSFSGNKTQGRLPGLRPYSLYVLNVQAFSGRGGGPPSTDVQLETPEGVPGLPARLKVTSVNLDSITLEWEPPYEHNGPLTSYTLKYQPINNTNHLGPLEEVSVEPNETTVTLLNLKYATHYKFYLNANTAKGPGPARTDEAFTIMDEALMGQPTVAVGKGPTEPPQPISPVTKSLRPNFNKVPTAGPTFGNVNSSVRETGAMISWEYWGPDKSMFVEYVVENSKEEWTREPVNGSQASYQIKDLKPGTSYKVRLVTRDQSSAIVHKSEELSIAVPAIASPQVDIATQGWFIGLMCAIALLILVLLIVCFIKRNKGGKYPVKEKEDAHADPEIQPMKEDDGTFGEYSDTEDHKPLKGSRTPSNGTVKKDDSDDSLVDYGEGGDGQFNEDGSFIGQYSGKKEKDTAEGNESSEAPSPVNAMNSFV